MIGVQGDEPVAGGTQQRYVVLEHHRAAPLAMVRLVIYPPDRHVPLSSSALCQEEQCVPTTTTRMRRVCSPFCNRWLFRTDSFNAILRPVTGGQRVAQIDGSGCA